MIKMRKKIVMMVFVTIMVCSFWGAIACEIGFAQPGDGLRRIVETSIMTADGEETPDDGLPGGPPGTPG